MPSDQFDPHEVLVSPLSELIKETGKAVAEAHAALGEANLELANSVPEELRQLGWMPSWFEISEVEAELSIALHIEQSKTSSGGVGKKKGVARLFAAPHNAKYQNAYKYSAQGKSRVTVKFAATPPPGALQPDPEG